MSFFDQASLVMIPSGYKTSKVYSIKPTDGSGDMAFTRSNDTATRVGPDGLIEKVRTNHILQSNSFDTTWGATTLTVTSGATDPNGGTTAWTAAATAASGIIQQAVTLTGLRTFSIYAKQGTLRYLYMGAYGGTISYATFDLQDGVVAAGTNARIESVGGGWYRCTCHSADGTTGGVQIFPTDTISSGTIGTGNILIWRAQYETGDIATDYIATTTAAVSVGPVANVPRLDYSGGSSCPRLLLEPQRTNLVTYSEQFANWQNAGGTTTANTAVSPSGYQDADTLTGARFQTGFATSQQYTASCFAKKVDGDNKLVLRLDVPALKSAQFDLATGTIDSVSTDYSATITPYGNGWYRCTITTPASTQIDNYVIISASGGGLNTYVWGAQLEAGAYATSYIPTLGAAVTRGAEIANKTGISSLIGQTEGTLFVEANVKSGYDTDNMLLAISDGTDTNLIYINRSNGRAAFAVLNGGAVQLFYNQSTVLPAGVHKIAIAYKQNDFAIYLDGTLVHSSSSGSVPACSKVNIGSYSLDVAPYNDGIKQALLFKTRLSNDSLAALTA